MGLLHEGKRMDTTFSVQLRILLCTHCGAALEASPAGGQTTAPIKIMDLGTRVLV
jgi:ribosomal protein S27E